MNTEHGIWAEKYRPISLEAYIGNETIKDKVKSMIEQNDVSHLLLYGGAGTGKTTLAKIIAKSTDCDYLYINASDENSVETVRNKIKEFASSISFKTFKLIILDESDFLTPSSQAALRNIMETYSKTTRFILTCNYAERIIEPIQSRCQSFHVTPPTKKDIAVRLATILKKEGVEFQKEDVATIVTSCYPDIRKCINYTQQQVVDGKLKLDKQAVINQDYKMKLLEYLKTGSKADSFKNIRQLLADNEVKDFTDLYRTLYDEVDSYAKGSVAAVMLIIAEAQYQDSMVIDKEINTMSMLIKILSEIKK